MSLASSSHREAPRRRERIEEVLAELVRRRVGGEQVPDEAILDQYADLLPELAGELAKLRAIDDALDQADQRRTLQALQRIEADWREDQQRPPAADSAAGEPAGHTQTLSGQNADQDADIPPAIGRYRVLELLGEGGFGRVYRARDDQLHRDVAIKAPRRRRSPDRGDTDAFLAEARIAAGLDHPAIVPVYDAGVTADRDWYVVSKLIEGQDLAAHLRQAAMTPAEAAAIVAVVADALHHAHMHGLVHRDIKPANILLDAGGQPFVADFGLALKEDDSHRGGSFAGTPAYMSPEQARGETHRVDGRSDIFSLGVVLYELLTGQRPFLGDTYEQLSEQIARREVRPPRQLNPDIPVELERICCKALAKRAVDRYANAKLFGEDLRCFLQSRSSMPTEVGSGPAEAGGVVPRGLRPFEANDAQWFLRLVPGPRDRAGLPESIRQWKTRIEETEPEETFAVGVLYGPSGCGKSSLVRAGLLPQLDAHVQPLYVEASASDTENRLLRRLRRRFPQLDRGGLTECLTLARRGLLLAPGAKLLLVLDQFEQWLHGKSEQDRRPLVEALRQCDGEHLQCLLLVRDDFWLALSRFLGELEVDLVQGRNAALVDLFDVAHARYVLAEFGRAWGRLPPAPAEPGSAQQAFLQRAVAAVAQQDHVIPVRLALLAEMVKSRTWNLATLRSVGGAEGVGVAFLEETFSSRSANPQNRLHQRAARAVLAALLPSPDSDLKGRICSDQQLLELSGYRSHPRAFRELMRILDSDTRLLTPADPEAMEGLPPASPDGRYYQLTHDYLVPSLRQWLTAGKQSTRRGRAELCLAERSAMWNARREVRQLPSLREWLAIRLLTRRDRWSEPQRKMMRIVSRRYAVALGGAAVLSAVFLFAGNELMSLARSALSQFRAATAPLWLALGQEEWVWPLLAHQADPGLRTSIVHRLSPVAISPQDIVAQLDGQTDVSIRRAMLLAAGQFAGQPNRDDLDEVQLRRVDLPFPAVQQLVRMYRDDPDPGIHAAAEWCLRRYGKLDQVAGVDQRLAASGALVEGQWYVTGQNHAMVVIAGPARFRMGSPDANQGRHAEELRHDELIPRTFAIASKETTVEQFRQFLLDNPPIENFASQSSPPVGRLPQAAVSWRHAAAYCNWLSRKEGIPEDQWCYLPNEDSRYAQGMNTAPNFLQRRGYRLPTEAEWEYACRAMADTSQYFGDDAFYLSSYAVCQTDQPWEVGQLKPNDYGLFDMLGNVAEWCHDVYQPYAGSRQPWRTATEQRVDDRLPRVIRGGSFRSGPDDVRCAARDKGPPDTRLDTVGFRVARSYP